MALAIALTRALHRQVARRAARQAAARPIRAALIGLIDAARELRVRDPSNGSPAGRTEDLDWRRDTQWKDCLAGRSIRTIGDRAAT